MDFICKVAGALSVFLRSGSAEDHFAGLDQPQLFTRDALDCCGIVAELIDLLTKPLVFFGKGCDFGIHLVEPCVLLANGEGAVRIEYGEENHAHCEQSEDADGDSRKQTLHYFALTHRAPYSNSVSRSF